MNRIKDRYDPEHDLPDGPPVPWYTMLLVMRIEYLTDELKKLADVVNNMLEALDE